jgi:hypothetical protein
MEEGKERVARDEGDEHVKRDEMLEPWRSGGYARHRQTE